MKIAITTSGDSLAAPFEQRFGRAPKYIVYDLDNDSFEAVDNTQNLNAPQGAGIQAAQNVAQTGAQAVISGHCGPKAFSVLKTAGITVYTSDAETVADALDCYRAGKLAPAEDADVEGHWL
ncbi:MAG: NifB/NifX family molybdenum-iron cluster-binding protein [Candidatus Hydrogenedentota bacterium]